MVAPQNLTFSMITGTRDQRSRALMQKADIYLVNYENLGWLAEALETYFVSKDRPLPFNGMICDEITKTKNSATNGSRRWRRSPTSTGPTA